MALPKKVAKPELPKPPPPWRVDPARLSKARKDAALTQFDLALLTGMSPRQISRMETGDEVSPSLVAVGAVADVLGVDIRWLCARPK